MHVLLRRKEKGYKDSKRDIIEINFSDESDLNAFTSIVNIPGYSTLLLEMNDTDIFHNLNQFTNINYSDAATIIDNSELRDTVINSIDKLSTNKIKAYYENYSTRLSKKVSPKEYNILSIINELIEKCNLELIDKENEQN